MLDTLNDERFVDQAPAQVYSALLDQHMYLCSVRTMYRILGEISFGTPTTQSLNSWLRHRTSCGRGTLRS